MYEIFLHEKRKICKSFTTAFGCTLAAARRLKLFTSPTSNLILNDTIDCWGSALKVWQYDIIA